MRTKRNVLWTITYKRDLTTFAPTRQQAHANLKQLVNDLKITDVILVY
jgi:hypothetical protein